MSVILSEDGIQRWFDVLYGKREKMLLRRKEVQIVTKDDRRNYNNSLREFADAA